MKVPEVSDLLIVSSLWPGLNECNCALVRRCLGATWTLRVALLWQPSLGS
jgi:hypothetical protein